MKNETEILIPSEIVEQADTLLKKYHMDYQVVPLPSFVMYRGMKIISPDFGLLNTKTLKVINQVKEGYYVSQNDEIMQMVLMGMRGFSGLKVVKCVDLFGGKKVFIQLEIKGKALIPRRDGTYDTITQYITILDSKDGSTKLSVGIGDHTASCDNEFWAFYKKGNAKFMHSSSLAEKIKEIPNLITFALEESMRMTELYKEFASTPVTRSLAMDAMAGNLLGYNAKSRDIKPRALSNMNKLYAEMKSEMDDKGDTLWGLHSGVTSWTSHTKAAPKRANGRTESAMTGTNYKVNQKSFKFVTEVLDELKKKQQLETT